MNPFKKLLKQLKQPAGQMHENSLTRVNICRRMIEDLDEFEAETEEAESLAQTFKTAMEELESSCKKDLENIQEIMDALNENLEETE